jgi:signal transduction histidine kinase
VPSVVRTDQPGARFRGRNLLRTDAERIAGAVGDEFPRCLVRHVSLAFDAKFAFVAEATEPNGEHVRVVSGWYDGDWMDEPFEYDTDGKPCALVVDQEVVAFPQELTKRFPRAEPARVIEAADSERRRVGRNLHDGAQQRLMAVSNLLKVARRKLDRGDEAVDVLRLADDELGAAQAELRGLARGLHPVALSERGLRSALKSLTVGCATPTTLEVGGQQLPEQVEIAAYFIVSESLTNANKYAGASAVQVRVVPEAETVLVEIVDDGRGGADPEAGTGLRGLADRIEALGGRLEVDSPLGAGTRVSARLPLATVD